VAKDLVISYLLDCYGELLSEKQRNLAYLYYDEDLSLAEISENEGITRQGANDLIKRAEHQLRDIENKLGVLKNARVLKGISEELRNLSIKSDKDISSELLKLSDTIEKITDNY